MSEKTHKIFLDSGYKGVFKSSNAPPDPEPDGIYIACLEPTPKTPVKKKRESRSKEVEVEK